MKLESFKKKNKKRIGIIIGVSSVVLLLTVIFIYRTYSIYEESQEFGVIRGSVPDQNYDVMFTFYLVDENKDKSMVETIPEGHDYAVSIDCSNGARGSWDRELWGPRVTNLTNARIKCNVTFKEGKFSLIEYGIEEPLVTEGNGLYEVTHEDASITYTTNETAINNLKMTEYRYAGEGPDNYVWFNEELWRIIGLVNTPEGQRLKLIRDASIGNYSWFTSASYNNDGFGINEWNQSRAQVLLNNGAYYKRTNGICYNGRNNAYTSCDFSSNGLTENVKEMIDTVTWNTGTNGSNNADYSNYKAISTLQIYNFERSNNIGKMCNGGSTCNDTVTRTTSWKGQVGLMYPSDYGYATSGGTHINRSKCLNEVFLNWDNDEITECKDNDWLYLNMHQWTMTPNNSFGSASNVYALSATGGIGRSAGYFNLSVRPTVFLRTNIKIAGGNGSKKNPYLL